MISADLYRLFIYLGAAFGCQRHPVRVMVRFPLTNRCGSTTQGRERHEASGRDVYTILRHHHLVRHIVIGTGLL
jgi:hypothetical protein